MGDFVNPFFVQTFHGTSLHNNCKTAHTARFSAYALRAYGLHGRAICDTPGQFFIHSTPPHKDSSIITYTMKHLLKKRIIECIPLCIACLYPSIAMAATGDLYCIVYSFYPIYLFIGLFISFFFMFVPYWHIKSCITQNKTITRLTGCKVSIIFSTIFDILCLLVILLLLFTLGECSMALFAIILTLLCIANLVIQFMFLKKSIKMISDS